MPEEKKEKVWIIVACLGSHPPHPLQSIKQPPIASPAILLRADCSAAEHVFTGLPGPRGLTCYSCGTIAADSFC